MTQGEWGRLSRNNYPLFKCCTGPSLPAGHAALARLRLRPLHWHVPAAQICIEPTWETWVQIFSLTHWKETRVYFFLSFSCFSLNSLRVPGPRILGLGSRERACPRLALPSASDHKAAHPHPCSVLVISMAAIREKREQGDATVPFAQIWTSAQEHRLPAITTSQ